MDKGLSAQEDLELIYEHMGYSWYRLGALALLVAPDGELIKTHSLVADGTAYVVVALRFGRAVEEHMKTND